MPALCLSKASLLYPLLYRLSWDSHRNRATELADKALAQAPHAQEDKLRLEEVTALRGGSPAFDSRLEMEIQASPQHSPQVSRGWEDLGGSCPAE